jgi:flagellar assembly factor FliW
MKVHTKPYGLIDVDERQMIHFPSGVLGFETLKRYVLLDAIQQPFYWLQSIDLPEVAFVLISPYIFRPDYDAGLSEEEYHEIGLEDGQDEELLLFTIVTIPPNNHNGMTANLQGPVIINKKTRVARQSISGNPVWKTKHSIMEEFAGQRTAAC